MARRYRGRKVAKAVEQPSDTDAIVARALRFQPLASENFHSYLARVWRGSLSAIEVKIAEKIYCVLMRAQALRAGEALSKMARDRSARSGESFERAFTAIAGAPAGGQLYQLTKTRIAPPSLPPSADAQIAADELDAIAKRIATEESCSPQQAYAAACKRFPAAYARSRGYDR
jgi:hypothetical protein